MPRKRLAVDMDGVLADVYAQFIRMHQEETGEQLKEQSLLGLLEEEAFPYHDKHVNSEGFFSTSPVINGATEIVKALHEKYELFIVSAAMEYPNSLKEKHDWLKEHFPFITWKQIVLCGSKSIICADIMIDDHFKNLDHFKGQTLLYTQPHNQNSSEKHHTRVNSWEDIKGILLG